MNRALVGAGVTALLLPTAAVVYVWGRLWWEDAARARAARILEVWG